MPQASAEYSHLGKEVADAAQSPMYPYERQGRHNANKGPPTEHECPARMKHARTCPNIPDWPAYPIPPSIPLGSPIPASRIQTAPSDLAYPAVVGTVAAAAAARNRRSSSVGTHLHLTPVLMVSDAVKYSWIGVNAGELEG